MAKLTDLPSADQLLPGRKEALDINFEHAIYQKDMRDFPEGCDVIWLGLGCFWGAERLFWQLNGVKNTAVGYAGGVTPNPTYEEVCSGLTAHTEMVQVVYDPSLISLQEILRTFWEAHDPTQGMRQGNDIGTQYRSAIFGNADQLEIVSQSKDQYQQGLSAQGLGDITTEISLAPTFFYAETYHQQYLHKNPNGYCGLKGTGVVCPI